MRSERVQSHLSASKLEAASLCPAYFQANKSFAWQGDRESANEGTIRHENEELQVPLEEIEDDERRLCAYRCRLALSECREKVFGDPDFRQGGIWRELRLWYDDSWSGQLDYVEHLGVDVLIADYKTLHGSHTPAPDNIQLLAQAVLYWKNNQDVETIYGALIEPFSDPIYTSVKYSAEYLEEKAKWLEEVVRKSYEDNPERVFGPKQCKWCSALYVCPSARSHLFSCIQKED
jgi:CRISPR/Cas system-associated exonuclease Cas4 (RecB family)